LPSLFELGVPLLCGWDIGSNNLNSGIGSDSDFGSGSRQVTSWGGSPQTPLWIRGRTYGRSLGLPPPGTNHGDERRRVCLYGGASPETGAPCGATCRGKPGVRRGAALLASKHKGGTACWGGTAGLDAY
jgi:hypothetical protein